MHDNTAYVGAASGAGESRPLEEISKSADMLASHADALDAYLERFNGPPPAEIQRGEGQPPIARCYRSEIDRLDQLVRRVGSIADMIGRLG